MRITTIEAKTLPEAWFLCLKHLLEGNYYTYPIERGSNVGQRRLEFDLAVVHIEYPGSQPLIPDTPAGVPPPSSQEYVNDYLPYLMVDVKTKNEDYTYGMDIQKQVSEVIRMYTIDGHNTNQAYIAVGDSQSIFLESPQCLRGIDTRIRGGALQFIVYFRSWDLWAGFPTNMAALQIMKETMANEIGVMDGELVAVSKGLHLYEYSWDLAGSVVFR